MKLTILSVLFFALAATVAFANDGKTPAPEDDKQQQSEPIVIDTGDDMPVVIHPEEEKPAPAPQQDPQIEDK